MYDKNSDSAVNQAWGNIMTLQICEDDNAFLERQLIMAMNVIIMNNSLGCAYLTTHK